MITRDQIEEFKWLYKKEYDVELDDEKAILESSKLLNLYKLVYLKG